jgi:hypothetical protein
MSTDSKPPSALFNGIDITEPAEETLASRRIHREQEAQQLHATGLSIRRIGAILDVPQGLVARWLSESPADPPPPEPSSAPRAAPTPLDIDAEAFIALRTQFQAAMAQVRGLADRLDRIEAREQQRISGLELTLQQTQTALEGQMATLRATLEAMQAERLAPVTPTPALSPTATSTPPPAPARRSRLRFWRGRGGRSEERENVPHDA